MDFALILALCLLAVYFVFIGWSHRRDFEYSTETSGAAPLNRRVKWITLAFSIFVVIGAGEYELTLNLFQGFGILGISFILAVSIMMLLMYQLVFAKTSKITVRKPVWPLRVDGFLNFSTPDIFFIAYGRRASLVATVIATLSFIAILQVQFIVGGTILTYLTGMPYPWAVLLIAITVALYCALGGFPAMFFTDRHQAVLMWGSLIFLAGYIILVRDIDILEYISQMYQSSATGFDLFSSTPVFLFIITLIAILASPDIWQRAHMVDNEKELQTGLRGACAGFLLFAFLAFIWNFELDYVNGLYPEAFKESSNLIETYFRIVTGHFEADINAEMVSIQWPLWLQVTIGLGLLSAFVSSADTAVMYIVSCVQNEFYRNCIEPQRDELDNALRKTLGEPFDDKELSKSIELSLGMRQIAVPGVVIISALFAVFFTNAVEIFTGVLGVVSVLGLPTLILLRKRPPEFLTLLAIGCGVIVALAQHFGVKFGLLPGGSNSGGYLLLPFVPTLVFLFPWLIGAVIDIVRR